MVSQLQRLRELSKEVDYYNVRENCLKVLERDDYKCRYDFRQRTRLTVTLAATFHPEIAELASPLP
ncbi:MAG: hypothetical protein P8M80_04550 [Pirellulaceae bacterium]|nr:hypothetical protein [Pirellulaceae bacterium]